MKTPDVKLIAKYVAKEISDNEFAKNYFPYIKHVAEITGKKYSYDGDDLTQELWQLFVGTIIERYNPEMSLDAYVFEYARRTCLHMKGVVREVNLSTLQSNDDPDSEDGDTDWIQEKNSGFIDFDDESIHSKIKGEKLLSKSFLDIQILLRVPSISEKVNSEWVSRADVARELIELGFCKGVSEDKLNDCVSKLIDSKKKVKDKKSFREADLPQDHQDLRNIRISLEMNKPRFSKAIGIHLSSLDAYEYGRTKTIPVDVMQKARELAKNYTDSLAGTKTKFESMKMSEIIEYWSEQSGINISDPDSLSVLLGTTRTTLRRWLSNESRADIERISELDGLVSKYQCTNKITVDA
jgi:DNA-binding transcriptional regulator YiaG/DNA-directed RNA polymerase specialized sigma24 family protein